MISNNNFYRGNDLLEDSFKEMLKNYFNPYEYNIESSKRNQKNSDILCMKSKSHSVRNEIKK